MTARFAYLVGSLILLTAALPVNRGSPRSLTLSNPVSGRVIPVTLYAPGAHRPLAIVLNGYGNKATDYGFLARALVAKGFAVAALDLDLVGDPPMPRSGDAALVRRPFWQVGVESIEVAARWIRDRHLATNSPLVLVGHSNGGDVAMLFATVHAKEVRIAFSLDNRRMPMPRTDKPRICSIRSSDQRADPGVLPSARDQTALDMRIMSSVALRHDDMWDGGTDSQKRQILDSLTACLSDPRPSSR